METRTIEAHIIAPIPPGNRVRIEFAKIKGLFGGYSTNTTHPKITDLSSGIVYGTAWHRQDPGTESHLEIGHSIEGTVKSCQVLTSGGDHAFTCTVLEVEIDS